ncbi:MAG: purine-nucleoside phosphorylase [Acutalibacter sp.]|nr:purine-nucleoside phosphorylase [Acutalibacter sp.]
MSASNTPTPHNQAKPEEIAPAVLMPGDPLRAKFIAETFLTGAVCVNSVRNMLAFTGSYQGRPVTVMGGGMGMPSVGIYTYELFHFYGVERIIRVGSAGTLSEKAGLRDLVIGVGASTDSHYAAQYQLPGAFAPIADFDLARAAAEAGERLGIKTVAGNILSSDVFYSDNADALRAWQKMGVLAVEMEAAALYMNAARAGKQALCLLTISDNPFTGQGLSAQERQNSFGDMMRVALELV